MCGSIKKVMYVTITNDYDLLSRFIRFCSDENIHEIGSSGPNDNTLIQATKKRDQKTGALGEFKVEVPPGRHYLVVDYCGIFDLKHEPKLNQFFYGGLYQ